MPEPTTPVESGNTFEPLVMDIPRVDRRVRKEASVSAPLPEPPAENSPAPPASVETQEPVAAVPAAETSAEPTNTGESEPKTQAPAATDKRDPRIAEFYKAQREADELRRRVAELEAARTATAAPAATQQPVAVADPASTKPAWDPEKYGEAGNKRGYDGYVEDLVEWRADQKIEAGIKTAVEKIEQRQQQLTEAQVVEQKRNAYLSKVAEAQASEAVPADYHQTLAQCPVRPTLNASAFFNEVETSDVAPQMLYHLAKNPEEIQRINSLPVRQQFKEFEALESRFKTPSTPQSEAPVPPVVNPGVSKAPPPPKSIPAGASVNTEKRITEAEAATKSPEEYQAWVMKNRPQQKITVYRGQHNRKGYVA